MKDYEMNSTNEVAQFIAEFDGDYLGLLRRCGGYYECPKDLHGKRRGPLVAYRGEYAPGKRYVGDIYANMAKAEQYPFVMTAFAASLLTVLRERINYRGTLTFCGAPEGGKSLADKLAMLDKSRYIYPEKKDGVLQWSRHAVMRNEPVVIVEDVCNNFSTTSLMMDLILKAGGVPVAIACFLNRSLDVEATWQADDFNMPVVSLVRKRIHEYRQNDEAVKADVESGKVVWNVKYGWSSLEQAMSNSRV